MARTYAELNTNLNTNQSTLIDQLNGRQGDANREVFFQIKDGTTPYNLEGKTIALFAKDAQGVIKATSTINDQTGISVGRFSMIIPKEFYQASGAVEDAYIQISYSDKVISTIPVSFQVIANTMLVTQTQSQIFIDSVQSLIDDTNQRLSTTTTSLTAVENAVEALKVTIGNLNDQYNSDLFAQKAKDNEFKGNNTFDNKIIAPSGLQGKADSAGQADNATNANHATNADLATTAQTAQTAQTALSVDKNANLNTNSITTTGYIFSQKEATYNFTMDWGIIINCRRIGNQVQITFFGTMNTDMPAWYTTNIYIPAGFRPTDTSVGWLTVGGSNGNFQIGNNGNFFNRATTFYKSGNGGGDSYISGFINYVTLDSFPN